MELTLIIADNCHRVIIGVDGLNIAAHQPLQGFKTGVDVSELSLFSRLHNHRKQLFVLFQRFAASGDPIFVRDVIQRTVKIPVPAITGAADISRVGETAILIHPNIPSKALIVDVICQGAEILFLVDTGLMDIVVAQIRLIMDIRNDVIAIQIVGEIDEVINVADLITSGLHNCRELLLIPLVHLINPGGKIVEFVDVFIFPEHIIDTGNRTLVIGNEPFLIGLAELVLRADPDPLKDLLHLFRRNGKFHPFTNQFSFVVLAEVGDKGFKVSIQNRHRHPPFNPSEYPAQYKAPKTLRPTFFRAA